MCNRILGKSQQILDNSTIFFLTALRWDRERVIERLSSPTILQFAVLIFHSLSSRAGILGNGANAKVKLQN